MDAEEKKSKAPKKKKEEVTPDEVAATVIGEPEKTELSPIVKQVVHEEMQKRSVTQWNEDHPVGSKVVFHGIHSTTRKPAYEKDGVVLVVIRHSGYPIDVSKLTFEE